MRCSFYSAAVKLDRCIHAQKVMVLMDVVNTNRENYKMRNSVMWSMRLKSYMNRWDLLRMLGADIAPETEIDRIEVLEVLLKENQFNQLQLKVNQRIS